MNTSALVSIQSIVYNFLNETGEFDLSNFKRYMQIAIRGFGNLNMTTVRSFSVAYITADEKGQAVLPDDFIDYRFIGHRRNGKLYPMSLNKNIEIYKDIVNGEIVAPVVDNTPISYQLLPHFNEGQYIVGLFATGFEVSPYAFNIDYNNKIIQLSSIVSSRELVVEYISTGVSADGNTYVPRKCEDALIEYLHWRTAKGNSKSTRGEKMDAKADYLEAEKILLDMETLPTAKEVYDAIYLNYNA